MSVSASAAHGRFLWYELMTSDVAAAQAFYGAVIGWGQSSMPSAAMAGGQYNMFTNAAGMVAGVVNAAEFGGGDAPPYWLAYFGTADADATVARATELGGAVIAPPMDIPGIGRFAILADPTGAVFALLTPSGEEMPPVDTHAPGAFSWHEVYTSDLERAWAFYTDLFGWVKTGSMEMGPMGEYRMYGLTAEKSLGGFSHTPPGDPTPPALGLLRHRFGHHGQPRAGQRARRQGAHGADAGAGERHHRRVPGPAGRRLRDLPVRSGAGVVIARRFLQRRTSMK